jgi:hypothetical protein
MGSFTLFCKDADVKANNGHEDRGDIVVWSADENGQVLWAASFGGELEDVGQGIDVKNGIVYCIGNYFSNSIAFTNPTHDIKVNHGDSDIVVWAHHANSGDLLWVQHFGGGNEDVGSGIAVEGEVAYCIGNFKSNDLYITSRRLMPNGVYAGYEYSDALVFALDALTGLPKWAANFGGNRNDLGTSKQPPSQLLFVIPYFLLLTSYFLLLTSYQALLFRAASYSVQEISRVGMYLRWEEALPRR